VRSRYLAPAYVDYAKPLVLNLDAPLSQWGFPSGVQVLLRLYEVGVLSVMVRQPLAVQELAEIERLRQTLDAQSQDQRFLKAGEGVARSFRKRLEPALEEAFVVDLEPERYQVICLQDTPLEARQLLETHRAQIAGLLIGEAKPEKLAAGEVEETLRQKFSYYQEDLVVVDWDAGFVVEPSGNFEDLLYIMEVSNLQVLVLRKYDRYLDQVLERGYEDYARLSKGVKLSAHRALEISRDLAEIRMDMAKVTDELDNTAKFFGEWYLARVYMGLVTKLHLADYRQSLEGKLETLNEMYHRNLAEIDQRRSLLLEILIVILIIGEIELALLGFW
jgi:hypothetical protein